MADKIGGVQALVSGCGIVAIRGADEAATLLARGADDLIYGSSKSSDEAATKGDHVVTGVTRYHRQKRIESLLENETATESFVLPAGYYAGYHIDTGHRTQLSYEFRTVRDRQIDVFLFDERRFRAYRNGDAVSLLTSGASLGSSSDTGERTLERNTEYVLIFDHTDTGVADKMDSPVTVDTKASLAVY